ncbi:hypothetical protein Agabi119p4_11371 [Agaricus bisporus var. burnettii]|uniref:Uncharacterized protein n=1 Tax=Agaricus bisporus var. burnettii TaxID=192524 RepID=A0A8H7BXM2_AGABI|nr:hypothetical protein Agabi119p4_11371 [Agaricus bisporus var. burnettii]
MGSSGRMILKKTPTERHWINFERLAAYVHEFNGIDHPDKGSKAEDDTVQALRNRFNSRGTHIFPSLRALSCWDCKELECLLSQELNSLRIMFFWDSPALCTASKKQLPVLKFLKNIHFAAQDAYVELNAPVSIFLLAHATPYLKSVCVTGISIPSEVAKAILQCKSLEEIALKVRSFDIEDFLDTDMPRDSLRKFHIDLNFRMEVDGKLEDSFYTELIRKLRAPNLVDFQFSGGPRFPHAFDIKNLLETILGHERFSDENQTRSIKLTPPPRRIITELPLDTQPYICTFTNALHVLTLPVVSDLTRPCASELQVLDLNEAYLDLSDKELGILGASLPHLKSLIFSARPYERKSRTTLTGLWLLAKHCKSLEDLGLLIDATIDWDALRTLTGFDGDHDSIEARVEHYALAKNSNVHNLYFGGSTVGDEGLAAEFFRTVFPKILNLCHTRSRTETNEMVKWVAIRDSLTAPNLM